MNKKVFVLTLFLTITSLISCKGKTSSSEKNISSNLSLEVSSSSLNSESDTLSQDSSVSSESSNVIVSQDSTSSNICSSSNDIGVSSNNSINTSSNEDFSSNSGSSSSSTSSSNSSSSVIETKLVSPILTIDNETGVVTWNEVDGATHYNYIINDGELQTTVNRTITLNDKENISVQASNDNTYSEFSNAVTYYDTSDVEIEKAENTKVYFHNSNIATVDVEVGKTISRPSDPTKTNYVFDDWYKDPFYQEKFDFSQPIKGKTVIYANWTPTDLIKDTYYWVKGSSHITSNVSSSSTGWKFLPLTLNEGQNDFKEYFTTVQVSGSSETEPAQFIVMDGFSDDAGRTYWKKGTEDFTIKSDGTYNIYFSAEHQYSKDIHILVSQSTNAGASYLQRQQNINHLVTPVVEVNGEDNVCSWEDDNNAIGYEVIVNNGEIQYVTSNSYVLNKNSHITVRTVYADGNKSNWSIPKANANYVIVEPEEDGSVYVYFKDSNQSAIKLNKGDSVSGITLDNEKHRTFDGWYLEPSLKTKVTFPYVVNENTIFYPKWNYGTTTEYYKLVDSSGNKIGGFVWNYDNYNFLEYELKYKLLDAKTYYIKSLDGSVTYSTFSIGTKNTYSIYFSEENLWDDPSSSGQKRNIYIRHDKYEIYFTNSLNWSTVNAYYWKNNSGTAEHTWPGTPIEKVGQNNYGQDIYKVSIDMQYDYVIFNNGSGAQTVDIPIANITNNAFYVNSTKDGNNYTVGSWTYNG